MRRILIPLDGSKLANSIIPAVRCLIEKDTEVFILTVLDDEDEELDMTDALKMLHAPGSTGIPRVRTIIRTGDPAPIIVEEALNQKVDTLAISSHGHSGLLSIPLGSVTEQVVNKSELPILLIKPGGRSCASPGKAGYHKLMVPLDGSDISEKAIDPAIKIAKKYDSEITFVRIGEQSYWERPDRTRNSPLTIRDSDVFRYLKACVSRVNKSGISSSKYVYSKGDPVERLWRTVIKTDSDIVICGTQRSQHKEWFMGSFLENIIMNVSVPLLLL